MLTPGASAGQSSSPTKARARHIKLSLVWVILLATLAAGLVPLAMTSYNAINVYQRASDQAAGVATDALDQKSIDFLQVRVNQVSDSISRFLQERVQNTRTAALLPRNADSYLAFYRAEQGVLWYPAGTSSNVEERRESVPLFREMAYIGADGKERVRIVDGNVTPTSQLRDVSVPANTTYLTEKYFADTKTLPNGGIYVGYVTGWHTSTKLQPGQPPAKDQAAGSDYAKYEAVVRFATPVFTDSGSFDGIVVLSLDARHLMEFVVHIVPNSDKRAVVWPDYNSGNYAYMWDNHGYLVAHPIFARLRGLDDKGNFLPSWTTTMTPEQRAKLPYAMQFGASPSPEMYNAVAKGERSYAINISQAGTVKANFYAPIPFSYGVYKDDGVFGGLVIGASVDEFHSAANTVRSTIDAQQERLEHNMLFLSLLGAGMLAVTATLVARGITSPVRHLTHAARIMEHGELDTEALNHLINRRVEDEVSTLAKVFQKMAEQVQLRERRLKEQIVELKIEIDEQKKSDQVAEITESDYFKNLRASAKTMRSRVKGEGVSDQTPAGAGT